MILSCEISFENCIELTSNKKSNIDKGGEQIIVIAHITKIISFNNYLITDHRENNFTWKQQQRKMKEKPYRIAYSGPVSSQNSVHTHILNETHIISTIFILTIAKEYKNFF